MGIDESKKLEDDLMKAATELLKTPPCAVQHLNSLLDKLEDCLKRVGQSPYNSMRRALDPVKQALVDEEFLNHSDVGVKVSVASCINQILRITAPNAPYGNEQLKEIFQLIVAAFANLSDTSSPLYCKRVSIMDVVADVGLWSLMVDCECYSSIINMFKHFLTNIREDHPNTVFSSMGIIMVLILEKMEKIPPELLSLLAGTVRKDVLPIARELGENVIKSCNPKLMQSIGFPPEQDSTNGALGEKRNMSELFVDKNRKGSSKEQVSKEEDREKGEKRDGEIILEDGVTSRNMNSRKKAKKEQEVSNKSQAQDSPVVGREREESNKKQFLEEENRKREEYGKDIILEEEGLTFLEESEKRREGEEKDQKVSSRSEVQDSLVVEKNRVENNKEKFLEEEHREKEENREVEMILEEEGLTFMGESEKFRKEVERDHKISRSEKQDSTIVEKDREESNKEQFLDEENREKEGNREVEMIWEKDGLIFTRESKKSRKGSENDQKVGSRSEVQDLQAVDKDGEGNSKKHSSEEVNREKGDGADEEMDLEEEGISSQEVKKGKKGPKKPGSKGRQVIKTRCSQRQAHEFLSNLTGTKRRIIESSIFSAFLDIPKRLIRPSLAHALIECYDPERNAFILGGEPLKFCGKEVEKCIGLSFEGKQVEFENRFVPSQTVQKYFETIHRNSRITDDSEVANKRKEDGEIRNSYSARSTMLLQKLKQMNVDGEDEADDFLRLSILYIFNVYFFPSNNKYINYWPLQYLENLEEFGSYAWGQAAYEYLRVSLNRASRQLNARKEIHTYLNGCVPLLETLVYERIDSLHFKVNRTNVHPLMLKYISGEGRSLDKIRDALARLKPDEIKKCEDCEDVC